MRVELRVVIGREELAVPLPAEALALEERTFRVEEEVELLDAGLEQLGESIVTELVEKHEQGEGQDNLDDLEQYNHQIRVPLTISDAMRFASKSVL